MARVCLSTFPTCFNMCIFSFAQCVGLIQLVSEFLAEGTAPWVSVRSVSVGGRSSEAYNISISTVLLSTRD